MELAEASRPLPRLGSFMRGAEEFDLSLFSVSNKEATLMDVQQRLLLQQSFDGLANMDSRGPQNVGIYVGISSTDYSRLAAAHSPEASPYGALSAAQSVACGRLAFTYNSSGAAVCTDTACSSSLVAASLAASALRSNFSPKALCAGVNMTVYLQTTLMFHAAGMLSADGRCKTLDAAADGYVRAEACAALKLTTSPYKEGLPVTLKGVSVNQDGRSSSLTAPNGPAQQSVMRAALRMDAGLSLSNLHMHGTGTALGDPIEVGAASAVLAAQPIAKGAAGKSGRLLVAISAGKSSIGHCEPAAGVSGLVQAIHGLCVGAAQPILHLTRINPHLEGSLQGAVAAGMPFLLPRSAAGRGYSSAQGPGSCGVSSFAFQGTNAHAVVGRGAALPAALPSCKGRPWQRTHCWVIPMPHALQTVAEVGRGPSKARTVRLCSLLQHSLHGFLWDHRVNGRVLFPGAGYMEVMHGAAATVGAEGLGHCLTRGAISAPLVLAPPAESLAELICEVHTPEGQLQVQSSTGSGKRLHMRSSCAPLVTVQSESVRPGTGSPAAESARCAAPEPLSTSHLYEQMAAAGLQYGPAFSLLVSAAELLAATPYAAQRFV